MSEIENLSHDVERHMVNLATAEKTIDILTAALQKIANLPLEKTATFKRKPDPIIRPQEGLNKLAQAIERPKRPNNALRRLLGKLAR
jgi:hypothetical protein